MLFVGSVLQHYETELKRLRSEYAGLTGNKRAELENLLLEGDLLEITMDEVQQLWVILQQDSELLASFNSSGLEEDELGKMAGDDKRKRRKRKDPSPTTSVSSNASTESAAPSSKMPPSKRRKRVVRSTTPKSSPSPATSTSSLHSKSIKCLLARVALYHSVVTS